MVEIRRLGDEDRPALENYLEPTAPRSLFLLGNARQGIDDRGGATQGRWIGAFDGGEMVGVAAWFRGANSIVPACGGHAAAILPALIDSLDQPGLVVGTAERVAEALKHLPWTVKHRQQELLLVVRWSDYRQPANRVSVRQVEPGEISQAADAIVALHREAGLPVDEARCLAAATRRVSQGELLAVREGDRLRAISSEAAATGRWLHIGSTWCAPDARRRGFAASCVAAVLERARDEGRASEGAALFTGRENVAALGLYERLGFRVDIDWELAFLGS